MSRSLWSDEEEVKLRTLYISARSFEEIDKEFPDRSPNAIRIKASRLGLRRPEVSVSNNETPNMLKLSNGDDSEENFFKCSGCGGWIHYEMDDEDDVNTIVCPQCKSVCRYIV
jgi:hypothetical protein